MVLGPDDPWVSYGRTVVEVRRPGEAELVIHPAAAGQFGRWPLLSDRPVHLVTAWDPGDERPGDVVNRARQVELECDLRVGGPQMWAAIGIDPTTGHREEGVAVQGLSEGEVLAVAARFRQEAIFAWTPTEWAIVGTGGGRRVVAGWSLAPARSGV